jgi:hypothetical protein
MVLYALASIGRSPGAPGFTHITVAWLSSAVAFWLMFPAKYALLNWLYEPATFLRPYGLSGAEASAREEGE